jgi:N-acetylglutamate synthase-like GNAT family acetyltransferase
VLCARLLHVTAMNMTTRPLTLREAVAADLDAVESLLTESELPTAGVREAFDSFVVVEVAGRIEGVAGLEIHGRDGVLRSVAVAPSLRGTGVGAQLTERVLDLARSRQLRRVYLLTTTAEGYFPRHGFRRIAREDASADVQQSVEFREACPASAVAMVLDLE